MKTAEEVLRQSKYKDLEKLILICEAMEEYASHKQEWIPVSIEPKHEVDILIYGNIISVGCYSKTRKMYWDEVCQEWVDTITHWQPLPPKPKQ